MTPERWQRVKALFDEALALPESARPAFIETRHGGDAALRDGVLRLLADHASADRSGFFEPAVAVEPDLAGTRLGPYRLEEAIGRGGMGVVYRAVREGDVEQRVAVKLIGRWAEQLSREHFRSERSILARLEHPAIARFIDAGSTPDGQPYLVMEYVRGQPITEYAERRGLSARDRIALFRKVCAAVQYAHRNLVVHRDLKPSNVLVTAEGEPKLLDFGIARLLEPAPDGATPTVTLLRPFTPEYASPEQARGEPITTASDVYTLGVVLYELLTGVRPFPATALAPDETLRTAGTRPPAPPSGTAAGTAPALPRELASDLDTIVLAALRWEPERRYGSVEALSEDLRRCLEGLPILARPDTLRYRAGKFARRNRGGVAAALVAALALLGGVVATARQARIAEENRQRADKRFADVRRLSNRLLFEIYDSLESLPGSLATRQLVVESSLEYLKSLSAEAGDDPGLLFELGIAWRRVGDVQGMPTSSSLGKTADALASYTAALALFDRLVGVRPDEPQYRYERAQTLAHFGGALAARGDFAGARVRHEEALGLYQGLVAAHGFHQARYDVIQSQVDLGDDVWGQGDIPAAAARYREGLALLVAWKAESPDDRRMLRGMGVVQQRLGDAAWALGEWVAARHHFGESLAIGEHLLRLSPDDAESRRDLATDASRLGVVQIESGALAEAEPFLRRALEIREQLSAAAPKDQRALRDLAESRELLGDLLSKRGRQEEGARLLDQAVALREAALATDPASVPARSGLADTLALRAGLRARAGAPDGALTDLREAVRMGEALRRDHPAVPEVAQRTASLWARLADAEDGARLADGDACRLRKEALAVWLPEARAGRLLAEFRKPLDDLQKTFAARCGQAVPTIP